MNTIHIRRCGGHVSCYNAINREYFHLTFNYSRNTPYHWKCLEATTIGVPALSLFKVKDLLGWSVGKWCQGIA